MLVGRDPDLALAGPRDTLGRERPAERAPPRREPQGQPGDREAVGGPPVRGRLRPDHRHPRRDDEEADRPVDRAEDVTEEPAPAERPGARQGRALTAADHGARQGRAGGDRRVDEERAGAERQHRQEGGARVAEPAERHPAGDRQRAPLDLMEAAVGTEDPLVGADRLAPDHGSTCPAIARAAFAT